MILGCSKFAQEYEDKFKLGSKDGKPLWLSKRCLTTKDLLHIFCGHQVKGICECVRIVEMILSLSLNKHVSMLE